MKHSKAFAIVEANSTNIKIISICVTDTGVSASLTSSNGKAMLQKRQARVEQSRLRDCMARATGEIVGESGES